MLMFWKAKLVLLAVPKTGTTALEEALLPYADVAILNPPPLKHATLRRYRDQLAPFFEQRQTRPLEVMAMVREPVSWLGSWFRYRARAGNAHRATSTASIGFEQFVDAWLGDPVPEFARVGRQSRCLAGSDGKPDVEHLFAYERFDEAVRFLENRLDRSVSVPRRNVSPDGIVALSAGMRARLHREAAPEFKLWDSAMARPP